MSARVIRAFGELTRPVSMRGESSQELADEVQNAYDAIGSRGKKIKPLPALKGKKITPVSSLDSGIRVTPFAALKKLSLGTSVHGSTSSLLSSLKSLSMVLKYIDSFENDGKNLSLKADVDADVRQHSRSVLSEELGVGFGLMIGERWCESLANITTCNIVNLDGMEAHSRIAKRSGSRKQPDYLLSFTDKSTPGVLDFVAVECKGASANESILQQLARGCSQIDSLLLDGMPMPGIVTSVIATKNSIEYRVVDPDWERHTMNLIGLDPKQLRTLRPEVQQIEERWNYPEKKDFLAKSVAIGNSKLATFAGDIASANRWWHKVAEVDKQSDSGPVISRTLGGEQFQGVETTIKLANGSSELTLFTGLSESVGHALREGDAANVIDCQSTFSHEYERFADSYVGSRDGEATEVSRDGSIMWARVKSL